MPRTKSLRRYSGLLFAGALLVSGCGRGIWVMDPAGPVGRIEKQLIDLSTILVLIVVIPVIALFAYIVYRYRDRPGNKAPYSPHWSDNTALEVIWWSIPIVIVSILGTATVKDTYALTHPPERSARPLTIEVTSLDWKWLFEYPGQHIATVNYCTIPANRPIQFILTSNAPMNSFWVPQLGGQEYTMPGMAMRLWLQADRTGVFYGHGANFTGRGFAHMQFDVVAKRPADFERWVQSVRRSAPPLTLTGYHSLTQQSILPKLSYSSYPVGEFRKNLAKAGGMYSKRDMSMVHTYE